MVISKQPNVKKCCLEEYRYGAESDPRQSPGGKPDLKRVDSDSSKRGSGRGYYGVQGSSLETFATMQFLMKSLEE